MLESSSVDRCFKALGARYAQGADTLVQNPHEHLCVVCVLVICFILIDPAHNVIELAVKASLDRCYQSGGKAKASQVFELYGRDRANREVVKGL